MVSQNGEVLAGLGDLAPKATFHGFQTVDFEGHV